MGKGGGHAECVGMRACGNAGRLQEEGWAGGRRTGGRVSMKARERAGGGGGRTGRKAVMWAKALVEIALRIALRIAAHKNGCVLVCVNIVRTWVLSVQFQPHLRN